MKTLLPLVFLLLIGCADPMVTGKPQDWRGKPAADLRLAWGAPTRIMKQTDGAEVWEYTKTGEFVAPAEDRTAFRMGGVTRGGIVGASGGVQTTKQGERLSQYENVWRFKIKNGKVRSWYAARIVDGQTVWQDQ